MSTDETSPSESVEPALHPTCIWEEIKKKKGGGGGGQPACNLGRIQGNQATQMSK